MRGLDGDSRLYVLLWFYFYHKKGDQMSNRDALGEMGQRLLSADKEIRNLHGEVVRGKRRLALAEKIMDEVRCTHEDHEADLTIEGMESCDNIPCNAVAEYDKAIREGR